MENITIQETTYTPAIKLEESGEISIKGKSYPENAFEFYEPIINWIEEYLDTTTNKTIANFEIIYFNSSTSKVLFEILDLFEEKCKDKEIEVNWIYDKEDESSKDAGEELSEDFEELKINLVEK